MSDRHLVKGDALPPVDPNRVRLYNMRYCPHAHHTKLVLEHKKIPYETVYVNLRQKPDWLFERNPHGMVPVLEYKGIVIYESAVCDEFLDEEFPSSVTGTHDLMPSLPSERAAVRLLRPKFDTIVRTVFRDIVGGDADQRNEHLKSIQSTLNEFEDILEAKNKPFFGGSQYGMVDLHGYPIFERFPALGMFGVDVLPVTKFPRLTRWVAAMQGRNCVKKVWMSPKLHGRFFAGYRSGNVEYDVEMDEDTAAVQSGV